MRRASAFPRGCSHNLDAAPPRVNATHRPSPSAMTALNMFPTRTQVVRTAFAVFATVACAGSAFAPYREAPEGSGAPTSRWESFRNDVGGLFGGGDGSAPDRRSGGYERVPQGE